MFAFFLIHFARETPNDKRIGPQVFFSVCISLLMCRLLVGPTILSVRVLEVSTFCTTKLFAEVFEIILLGSIPEGASRLVFH